MPKKSLVVLLALILVVLLGGATVVYVAVHTRTTSASGLSRIVRPIQVVTFTIVIGVGITRIFFVYGAPGPPGLNVRLFRGRKDFAECWKKFGGHKTSYDDDRQHGTGNALTTYVNDLCANSVNLTWFGHTV